MKTMKQLALILLPFFLSLYLVKIGILIIEKPVELSICYILLYALIVIIKEHITIYVPKAIIFIIKYNEKRKVAKRHKKHMAKYKKDSQLSQRT